MRGPRGGQGRLERARLSPGREHSTINIDAAGLDPGRSDDAILAKPNSWPKNRHPSV